MFLFPGCQKHPSIFQRYFLHLTIFSFAELIAFLLIKGAGFMPTYSPTSSRLTTSCLIVLLRAFPVRERPRQKLPKTRDATFCNVMSRLMVRTSLGGATLI